MENFATRCVNFSKLPSHGVELAKGVKRQVYYISKKKTKTKIGSVIPPSVAWFDAANSHVQLHVACNGSLRHYPDIPPEGHTASAAACEGFCCRRVRKVLESDNRHDTHTHRHTLTLSHTHTFSVMAAGAANAIYEYAKLKT